MLLVYLRARRVDLRVTLHEDDLLCGFVARVDINLSVSLVFAIFPGTRV